MPSPPSRCRRAAPTRRPGRPRPGPTASGRPAPTARAGSRPSPRPGSPRRSTPRPRTRRRTRRRDDDHPDALAVVAAPRGLQHHREAADDSANATASAASATSRCRGLGMPSSIEPRPHHALVLGVHQRLRARAAGMPLGGEGVQVLASGRARGRRSPPRSPRPPGAGRRGRGSRRPWVAHHLGGGDVGPLGEQPQRARRARRRTAPSSGRADRPRRLPGRVGCSRKGGNERRSQRDAGVRVPRACVRRRSWRRSPETRGRFADAR